jgi:hypothetical protein
MKSAHPPLLVNAHFYLHKNQQLRDKISKSCRKCDILNFKLLVKRYTQPQPLQDILLQG